MRISSRGWLKPVHDLPFNHRNVAELFVADVVLPHAAQGDVLNQLHRVLLLGRRDHLLHGVEERRVGPSPPRASGHRAEDQQRQHPTPYPALLLGRHGEGRGREAQVRLHTDLRGLHAVGKLEHVLAHRTAQFGPRSGLRFGQIEFGTAIRACNDHRTPPFVILLFQPRRSPGVPDNSQRSPDQYPTTNPLGKANPTK